MMSLRTKGKFAALVFILLALLPFPLSSQAQDSPAATPKFEVSVELVEVDAVVTDHKGNHVANLTASDFQVYEDGKLQTITHFSWEKDQPKASTGGTTAEAANAPQRALRREEIRRTVVFLVDDLHIQWDHMGNLTTVARKFSDEQVQPGDLVSVMSTRSSMGIYEQLTSDHSQIEAALKRLVRHVGTFEDSDDLSTENTGNTAENLNSDLKAMSNTYFLELNYKLSMATLARAIEALQQMPGRKAVAFFSEGLLLPLRSTDERMQFRVAETVKKVTDLANQSGVAIYVINPSGLINDSNVGIKNVVNTVLAKDTGGKAVSNTNDLSRALGQAMDDMTGYYVLGYQPDRKSDTGRTHKIKIKLLRKDLSLRSSRTKTSAAAEMKQTPPDTPQESRHETMKRLLFSPYTTGDITLRLTPLYSASSPGKNGERQSLVRALLSIDGSGLQFVNTPIGNGAVVDFVVAAYDSSYKMIAQKDQRATIKAPSDGSPLQDLSSILEIKVTKPGPYLIHSAVRDDTNGHSGSASVYLEVPDYNRQRIMLSSVVLSREGEPNQAYSNPAARVFAASEPITYACMIYGAKREPGTGNSQVEVELKLFNGGVQVFNSHPIAIASSSGSDNDIVLSGTFKLPASFTPGEYALKLLVRDKLAEPKFSSAAQWTDMTVIAPQKALAEAQK
jgi:VWFA-related protein